MAATMSDLGRLGTGSWVLGRCTEYHSVHYVLRSVLLVRSIQSTYPPLSNKAPGQKRVPPLPSTSTERLGNTDCICRGPRCGLRYVPVDEGCFRLAMNKKRTDEKETRKARARCPW